MAPKTFKVTRITFDLTDAFVEANVTAMNPLGRTRSGTKLYQKFFYRTENCGEILKEIAQGKFLTWSKS